MCKGLMHEAGELGASGAEKLDVPVPIVGMDVVVVDAGEVEAWETVTPLVDGLVAADFALDPKDV